MSSTEPLANTQGRIVSLQSVTFTCFSSTSPRGKEVLCTCLRQMSPNDHDGVTQHRDEKCLRLVEAWSLVFQSRDAQVFKIGNSYYKLYLVLPSTSDGPESR